MEDNGKEYYEPIIKQSKSLAGFSRKIFGVRSEYRKKLSRDIIKKYDLDTSHFIKREKRQTIIKVCPVCWNEFKTKKDAIRD